MKDFIGGGLSSCMEAWSIVLSAVIFELFKLDLLGFFWRGDRHKLNTFSLTEVIRKIESNAEAKTS